MKGLKICTLFAAFGFLLSLITGLFSHTSFISVLLKALLFAVVFGILGFAIDIVFQKFLADGSGADFSVDNGTTGGSSSGNQGLGQVVDITIQDEELDNSTSENHFFVNENHQMLNDSDYIKDDETSNNTEESNGFVPLKNFENVKNVSGKEAVKPDSVVVDNSKESDNKIDTLPDMNGLSFDNNTSSDSIETDSDFTSSTSFSKSSDEPTEIKDAALMAKAISSILSDEDA